MDYGTKFVRVDHGHEWTLSLYIQEMLADLCTDNGRSPHSQTSSKQVHIMLHVHSMHNVDMPFLYVSQLTSCETTNCFYPQEPYQRDFGVKLMAELITPLNLQ